MGQLTVIVPLYNTEKYIGQCLQSIVMQGDPVEKIIIVDDGSTDSGADICKKYAENDSRVQIIYQENKGLSAARYTGLKACETKYVTFVDADDFIKENAYESAIELMEQDIDMIFYEFYLYYSDELIKKESHILDYGLYNRQEIIDKIFPKLIWDFNRQALGPACSIWSKILKKNLLLDIYKTLPEQSFYYGEDAAVVYPYYKFINTLKVSNNAFYMYRQQPSKVPSYIANVNFFDEVYRLYKHLKNSFYNYEYEENILKQIEYYYIYSVELKKKVYNDYKFRTDFLFPFEKVERGKSIVLYGAGEVGKSYYKQLARLNYYSSILWVDKNADIIKDERVKGLDYINSFAFDVIVIAIENKNVCDQVKKELVQRGIDISKIII